jgi:hypothetical protein
MYFNNLIYKLPDILYTVLYKLSDNLYSTVLFLSIFYTFEPDD